MPRLNSSFDKTDADMIAELEVQCKDLGRPLWCEMYGFSTQFICDVLKKRRGITPKLAAQLGYRQVSVYEYIGRVEALKELGLNEEGDKI